jgi:hypothetical protein
MGIYGCFFLSFRQGTRRNLLRVISLQQACPAQKISPTVEMTWFIKNATWVNMGISKRFLTSRYLQYKNTK